MAADSLSNISGHAFGHPHFLGEGSTERNYGGAFSITIPELSNTARFQSVPGVTPEYDMLATSLNFNANKLNSVYNGDTVTPLSLSCKYIIRY